MTNNCNDLINHSGSFITEDETLSAKTVLDSNYVGYGLVGKQLENKFCIRTQRKYAFAVSSGFHALVLAIKALDLPITSLISIPVLTCPSLAEAIKTAGHKIHLADICDNDLSINVSKVSENSRAIIAPHPYGSPLDVKRLEKLGIPWIEDCATSPATMVNDKVAGSWGTISIFSFNSTKYITAGAGGMVVTDDLNIAEKIQYMLDTNDYAKISSWMNPMPAKFPGRLSDINSAIALTQLNKLDSVLYRRRQIAKIYSNNLSELSKIRLPYDNGHSFYRYIIKTTNKSELLVEKLRVRGIDAKTNINPWLDEVELIDSSTSDLIIANSWKDHLLSLPIHPSMSDSQAEYITDCLINLI